MLFLLELQIECAIVITVILHCLSSKYTLYRDVYLLSKYEGRLKSSWTHLITPSRNFVEIW